MVSSTEKRWLAISARTFTLNGTSTGLVTISDTSDFHVKQIVFLNQSPLVELELEIKLVLSPTELLVGLPKTAMHVRADISAYLVGSGASISSKEQPRPSIFHEIHERATYEEEPIMAKRNILVNKFGDFYDGNNPLPISGNITAGSENKLEKYVLHHIDEPNNTDTYFGKEDVTGTWILSKFVESGKTTAITYANLSNNGAQTTLTLAWTNRATLTYDLVENLTGV